MAPLCQFVRGHHSRHDAFPANGEPERRIGPRWARIRKDIGCGLRHRERNRRLRGERKYAQRTESYHRHHVGHCRLGRSAGDEDDPGAIPIGATFKCAVAAPPGSGLVLNTVTWAGLGNLGSYLQGDSDSQPPQSMKPSAPVLTPQVATPGSQFVVVQPKNNYNISVKVTYTNAPGEWTSSVAFMSGAMPTYNSLKQVQMLKGQPVTPPAPNVNPLGNLIQFTNGPPDNDGMGVEAQTNPAFLGNYMLMQLTSTLRQFKDAQGNVYQIANPAGGSQAFDNGAFGGQTNTLGMQVAPVSTPGNTSFNGWAQAAGDPARITMQMISTRRECRRRPRTLRLLPRRSRCRSEASTAGLRKPSQPT